MKKEQLYSEEEKQLFIDHFLLKGDEVKKQFREYVENFIKTNGVDVAENLKKQPVYRGNESINQLQRNHWVYDSNYMLWDQYSRDNVLTYFLPQLIPMPHANLSHKEILTIFKNLDNINKLHPNWNHKNKEGNTPLHIVAGKGQLFLANKLINDFNIDVDIKNKNGDYYTFLLVKPETHNKINKVNTIAIETVFEKNYHHFENASMDKLLEIKNNIELLKELDFNARKKDPTLQEITPDKHLEQTQNQFNKLDKFLEHYYLKKVIPTNENIKVAKKKI